VDAAVAAAREAFETTWGSNKSGTERGQLLYKLAQAFEDHTDELAMIESLDSGKAIEWCKADIGDMAGCFRYYA
jgi:aldehyde dehydrogenase (NAD+)